VVDLGHGPTIDEGSEELLGGGLQAFYTLETLAWLLHHKWQVLRSLRLNQIILGSRQCEDRPICTPVVPG